MDLKVNWKFWVLFVILVIILILVILLVTGTYPKSGSDNGGGS